MTTYKSDFLNVLEQRGFIHQCSDFAGLDALAAKGQAIGYVGYDCTAPSLHIGNFIFRTVHGQFKIMVNLLFYVVLFIFFFKLSS